MPLDLAQGRVLAYQVGKRHYTLTLKPIEKKAWLKYFAAIENSQELVDGELVSTFDSSAARIALLESHLVDATGYTKEGESITAVEGWQAKLPMAHRRAAADLLVACEVVPVNDDDLDSFPKLGTELVTLKATWTAVDGKMQQITGLQHVFRSPTAEHQKRYSRASSRSVVTGGRNGTTHWMGAQDVLMEIYDELIEDTQGYVCSKDMGEFFMDGYHKVVAAGALFAPIEIG